MQAGPEMSPFKRHNIVVAANRMQMKGSPLWHAQKATPLMKGQIGRIVANMHVGGFEMLQVCPGAPSRRLSLYPSVWQGCKYVQHPDRMPACRHGL